MEKHNSREDKIESRFKYIFTVSISVERVYMKKTPLKYFKRFKLYLTIFN
jgi:hypothetical protein